MKTLVMILAMSTIGNSAFAFGVPSQESPQHQFSPTAKGRSECNANAKKAGNYVQQTTTRSVEGSGDSGTSASQFFKPKS